MFFGKLWVRIRGELVTLRDDLLGEGELRQKGKEFLEKLERSLDAPDFRADADGDLEARLDAVTRRLDELEMSVGIRKETFESGNRTGGQSAEGLEKALDELKRSRESGKDQSPDKQAPPPNPRTLG